MRAQERLIERGETGASDTRSVRIRKAAGTNTSHAVAIVEGTFPKGSFVSLTIDTNGTTPTVYRYPAATGVAQETSALIMARELTALIDAAAKLSATVRGGVISILAAGGDTVVDLTLPAFTLNDVAAPGVVGVPVVSAILATTCTLTWTAAADFGGGVTTYLIDRAPNSGGVPGTWVSATPASVSAPTVTANITGLTTATQYWFGVRAQDAAGNIGARRVIAAFITTA